MLPVIHIGPLALPAPELILLLGFWLGLELAEKQAQWFKIDSAQIYHLTIFGVLAGLVGARLGYAARSPAAFITSPLSLLSPTPQMLDPIIGWAAALLAVFIAMRARKLAFWPTLDALTTLLSVLAIVVGLANFASGDAFGQPAQVPWAIELWGEQRHPSQVYETLAALLVAAAIWPGSRIASLSTQPGQAGLRFWAFLGFSAAARVFLETFRGDSILLLGSFRQAQVAAWFVLAVCLWQAGRRLNPITRSGQDNKPDISPHTDRID